ncbi:MAG: Peptidase [Microgenomates group bacterium GW2011_GWA2_46_7]|nr:MAG: Peptidase [Microgenomates group bacterium GW2011_GWA2_46_7]
MRLKFSLIGLIVLLILVGIIWRLSRPGGMMLSPGGETVKEQPYDKYSFERLVTRGDKASEIEVMGDKFYYVSEGRRISGEINQAEGEVRGIVVMARGYAEKEGYKTGTGTKNAATYYAKNGYTTYAPDFSGYGESDPEDTNALGARLVKPVEILDLIASVPTGNRAGQPDSHGAGVKGVILWAPVSKPFPYNILYYTDEAEDRGKWLRGEIAKFEADYDVYNYSLDRYLDWITMPVQIHQGSVDSAVPKKWSDELVMLLEELEKEVTYYEYFGADHNMRPSWNVVVARDVAWFGQLMKEAP